MVFLVMVMVTMSVVVLICVGRLLDHGRLGGEHHPGHGSRVEHR